MMKKILSIVLSLVLLTGAVAVAEHSATADMFTSRDLKGTYDTSSAVEIHLTGDTASASGNQVSINGNTVVIREEGVYLLSGTLNDGMIVVDADDAAKVQLVLNGVTIHSETSAAIYVPSADKVFVTLGEGTENVLSNGGSYVAIDNNTIDAVVFSKSDLTLNGNGALVINAEAGHGVVSKDDLVITGGVYTITAASHGLNANDSIRLCNAQLTIAAGKDGLHIENEENEEKGFLYLESGELDITAEGDGISTSGKMDILGGNISIKAGGGYENAEVKSSNGWGAFGGGRGGFGGGRGAMNTTSTSEDDSASTSMKGLKSGGEIFIRGGVIVIDSADDGVHTNTSITISDGELTIASGDDGVHADDTLTISGGSINITNSYEGLEAEHLLLQGGDIRLVASDDGLNAAGGTDSSGTTGGRDGMFGGRGGRGASSNSTGTIEISGGSLYILASGDGIDANGSLAITGGYTVVVTPTMGDTAILDYDTTGTISGGTFIGTGSGNMFQNISGEGQRVIAVSVGSQSAGNEISLADAEGNILVTQAPEYQYQVVVISTPEIMSGSSYTLKAGSASGTVTAE